MCVCSFQYCYCCGHRKEPESRTGARGGAPAALVYTMLRVLSCIRSGGGLRNSKENLQTSRITAARAPLQFYTRVDRSRVHVPHTTQHMRFFIMTLLIFSSSYCAFYTCSRTPEHQTRSGQARESVDSVSHNLQGGAGLWVEVWGRT